jgi:DNA-binding MurR/RpiR family transcriptional regulator
MYQTKPELLQAIQDKFPQIGRGQKKVAQYVLAHTEEVAFITAAELGRRVGVSEATVVRFAGLLGYPGFPAFQAQIQDLMRQDISTLSRLEKRAEHQAAQRATSILQEILQADQMNLGLLAADTSEATFAQAVKLIVDARDIYVCGLRTAYAPAFFLWFSLRFFRRRVHLVTPGIGDLPEQLGFVNQRDVVIGISFKRYARRTVEIVRALQKRQARIIAISDNLMSPLTPLADAAFTVRTDVSSFIESQTVVMSLINALVTAVALQQKHVTMQELSKLEDSFQEFATYVM